MSKLDESVGLVVQALDQAQMLENTIIVFSTDNGGPAAGFNINAASNWPLKGVKNTLWEGGVRGAGFIWSPLIDNRQQVSNELMHIVDWLPTLYAAAGGNMSSVEGIDGLNLWENLARGVKSTRRTEALLNIDNVWGSSGLIVGDYKIVRGTNYNGTWDNWYGPAGDRNPTSYDLNWIEKSPAGVALTRLKLLPDDNEIL